MTSQDAAPAIPTGSRSLDEALGTAGLCRGIIAEVFGPAASGKTTLALHLIANVQRQGGTAAVVDAEHALSPDYARKLGVDVDALLLSQPDSAEQALEIVETLTESRGVDLIVVDSVAALVPRAELASDLGTQKVGLQARLLSDSLRKVSAQVHQHGITLVFLNQLRHRPGAEFGNPETTPGGRALKIHASVRLDLRCLDPIEDRGQRVGSLVRVRVVKNRQARPFRSADLRILVDRGIVSD